jgi:hypothetical protein
MANQPRIWDYLNAITQTKDITVLDDLDFDKVYQPFIINKMLSQHRDCVLAANMMNERPDTPKKAQFLFLLNTLRPRFRKNEKSVKQTDPDDVGALAEYYECSTRHARDLMSLHSSAQLAIIHKRLDKGGITKKGRTHGEST